MPKHVHNWQFVALHRYLPKGQLEDSAEFICECGAFKIVEVKGE